MQNGRQWKSRVQEIFQICQDELKRTTEIGKKMLMATKTNSILHDAYEEIGHLAVSDIKNNKLKWENERVKELMLKIKTSEEDLKEIEKEVNKIKFSSAPQDVSDSDKHRDKPN